ncbi:hypothetical protein AJ78_00438 [Emergomyces pasteurianus Ep9510]|uniref:Uncharacterized protein n=1 Tax=Emergomyces pasteurianus Ep9510 TaxID=1447872 RepID=A0A1J9QW98_9EURO|nr:hypothetical protein AJ78_00438 [Emergomyces pasteurianus Ep9510]
MGQPKRPNTAIMEVENRIKRMKISEKSTEEEEVAEGIERMKISGSTPDFEARKTCRAEVVTLEPNISTKNDEVPVPEPGPDEVVLRLRVVITHIMCMDVSSVSVAPDLVKTVGCNFNQWVGEVVKLGSGVRGIKVGSRRGISREDCCSNREEERKLPTLVTSIEDTLQLYITVPKIDLIPIPYGMPDRKAVLLSRRPLIFAALENSRPNKQGLLLVVEATATRNGLLVQIALDQDLRPLVVNDLAQQGMCVDIDSEHLDDQKNSSAKKVLRLVDERAPVAVLRETKTRLSLGTLPDFKDKGQIIYCQIDCLENKNDYNARHGKELQDTYYRMTLPVMGLATFAVQNTDLILRSEAANRGQRMTLWPIESIQTVMSEVEEGKTHQNAQVGFNVIQAEAIQVGASRSHANVSTS